MAQHTVMLEEGIKVGDRVCKEAVIRELRVGDLLAAMDESEKVVMTPGPNGPEPQLVMSPTAMSINTLRRQIDHIGDILGPIEHDVLEKLSTRDLDLLREGAEALEAASYRASVSRGRAEAASSAE